jgi:carbon monoxide dehydrogenase subunit G
MFAGPDRQNAMFTSRASTLISRRVEDVFAFIEDARNRPRWDDSIDSEELTSPEPIGVGTTVRTTLRSMGREYVYTWEVIEHRPPTRMTIESTSGPFPTTLVYELAEREGATQVDFAISARPAGLLRLFQAMIARNTQKNLDRSFARLKQALEGGPGS